MLATNPLVSIVLICYNQEKTIEAALESLLVQTYKNTELVISDDCSTDSTVKIIKTFLKRRGATYKLNVNEKNLGIGGNLRVAMSLVSGQFIVPATGDDISISDRIKLVVDHWIKSGKKVLYINTDLIRIDRDGNYLKYIKADNFTDYPNVAAWIKNPQFQVGEQYWSRVFYEKLPPMLNVYGDDQILAFRAIILGVGSTMHQATAKHRIGGISTTKPNSLKNKINRLVSDAEHSILDFNQVLLDAKHCNIEDKILELCKKKIAEAELIIYALDGNNKNSKIIAKLFNEKLVSPNKKVRLFFYSMLPWLMAIFFKK
jgi:glycosyltransferase involved in cell wall biosynthesis